VFWGELHGMAFNQRPLDDFYQYARDVTKLDFAAAMLFSYNICVQDMWRQVVEAAERNTREGQFIALAGFECGTPPDDSHRCAYFPDPRNVPPIFCETRPPAHDPHLHARFHPDTLRCETAEAFFRAVERYGGFVGGHFHTRTYRDERLAEIHQKQQPPVDEERRLFDLLRAGHRFGLVGGSDTHDSMPGNPHPEPGCPRPAGCTGVWAGELTVDSLCEAFRARRVFATTGERIAVRFDCGDAPMGSVLPASTLREFRIQVDAPHALARVELLHDGKTIHEWQPDSPRVDITHSPCPVSERRRESYLVRATQADGHRAWSSPIWFDQALRDT
jgi:hypothetical protein